MQNLNIKTEPVGESEGVYENSVLFNKFSNTALKNRGDADKYKVSRRTVKFMKNFFKTLLFL